MDSQSVGKYSSHTTASAGAAGGGGGLPSRASTNRSNGHATAWQGPPSQRQTAASGGGATLAPRGNISQQRSANGYGNAWQGGAASTAHTAGAQSGGGYGGGWAEQQIDAASGGRSNRLNLGWGWADGHGNMAAALKSLRGSQGASSGGTVKMLSKQEQADLFGSRPYSDIKDNLGTPLTLWELRATDMDSDEGVHLMDKGLGISPTPMRGPRGRK